MGIAAQPAAPEGGGLGGRYRVAVPAPLDARAAVVWKAFVDERIVSHATTSAGIALYGELVAEHYATHGPPQGVRALDDLRPGRPATNALRGTWDERNAMLSCATAAIEHEPHMLLAEPLSATRARAADSFHIFGTSALFKSGVAVPAILHRAYGDIDQRADEAIRGAITDTATVAANCDCSAPIVTHDLGLADHLVGHLAGDTHPFAAALGPAWSHREITPHDVGRRLLSYAPQEVFASDGEHVNRLRAADGTDVRLARMRYRERPQGRLFYARVATPEPRWLLLRPPGADSDGSHAQLARAAELAAEAVALEHERPLATFGLESYCAGPLEDQRWCRHVAILQGLLSFDLAHLIDPDGDA